MSIKKVIINDIKFMTIPTHGPLHQLKKLFEMRDLGVFHSTMLVGCHLPTEVHECDEIIFRINGESMIEVNSEKYSSGACKATIIPAGTRHQSSSLESNANVEQIVLLAYNQEPGSI